MVTILKRRKNEFPTRNQSIIFPKNAGQYTNNEGICWELLTPVLEGHRVKKKKRSERISKAKEIFFRINITSEEKNSKPNQDG